MSVYIRQQLNIFSTYYRINPKPTEPLTIWVFARLVDFEVLRISLSVWYSAYM